MDSAFFYACHASTHTCVSCAELYGLACVSLLLECAALIHCMFLLLDPCCVLLLIFAVQIHGIGRAVAREHDVVVTTTECYTVTTHNTQDQKVKLAKYS